MTSGRDSARRCTSRADWSGAEGHRIHVPTRDGCHLAAFGAGTLRDEHVKVGVLTASLLAAVLASGVLRARNRTYRQLHESETADDDSDGVPDVYVPGERT